MAEYRCPYCAFLKSQRSVVVDHIRKCHKKEVGAEPNGEKDAELRMVNLARRGVRTFGEDRMLKILHPLRREIGARSFPLVVKTAKDLLAHALVAVTSELHTGRHFTLLSGTFRRFAA